MNQTYDSKSHMLCMGVWRSVAVDLTVWFLWLLTSVPGQN